MTFADGSLNPAFADRAYTYKVITPPANTPISVDEVKSFAKISTTADNDLIAILIKSAVAYAEGLTRRDFITRTYKTFRDQFPGHYKGPRHSHYTNSVSNSGNEGFEIRKSALLSVAEISYINSSDATTIIPTSVYYATEEEDYSAILTKPGQCWPTDASERLQAISITFDAGYGPEGSNVPDALRDALLRHVTFLYENRGDCEDVCGGGACGPSSTPQVSKSIYLQYRIENL